MFHKVTWVKVGMITDTQQKSLCPNLDFGLWNKILAVYVTGKEMYTKNNVWSCRLLIQNNQNVHPRLPCWLLDVMFNWLIYVRQWKWCQLVSKTFSNNLLLMQKYFSFSLISEHNETPLIPSETFLKITTWKSM